MGFQDARVGMQKPAGKGLEGRKKKRLHLGRSFAILF